VSFPSTPANGDTYVLGAVTYQYDSTNKRWSAIISTIGSGGSTDSFAALGHTDGGVPEYLTSGSSWATTTAPSKLLLDGGNF
jgi:hypothetical protein